jgi:hypothetical protein
LDSTTALASGQ